jgi:hypothetical protein
MGTLRILQRLPIALAATHALLVLAVFGLTVFGSNLQYLPTVLERIDYPFSLLINLLNGELHYATSAIEPWVMDMIGYGFLGSAWYFGIGFAIRFALSKKIGVSSDVHKS